MTSLSSENPKLRMVDAQPLIYEGESYLYLRDPLSLSDQDLLIPEPYIPALSLCDGTHTLAAIRGALALRYGVFLTNERLKTFVDALDSACLLENAHSQAARAEATAQYRAAPNRAPASAGASYPEEPTALKETLQGYFQQVNGKLPAPQKNIRGLVSPHIDYERGGTVYAEVWGAAAQAVRQAELAIILGTDHFSEGYPFTLTHQSYATPFGILPTPTGLLNDLSQAIGPSAFRGELHHQREHSVELAAIWLHYLRGGEPIAMLPILCGSLETALHSSEFSLSAIYDVLRRAINGKNALIIAAGDLSHVGPAFDTEPVDNAFRAQLQSADTALIESICAGNADRFYQSILQNEDRNNVCGVAPIYHTLQILTPTIGQQWGYAVCPADEQQTSVVTISGITLQ